MLYVGMVSVFTSTVSSVRNSAKSEVIAFAACDKIKAPFEGLFYAQKAGKYLVH